MTSLKIAWSSAIILVLATAGCFHGDREPRHAVRIEVEPRHEERREEHREEHREAEHREERQDRNR
jgi:hypothetical protein